MNDSSNPCVVPARNSFQFEWLKPIRCMQICTSHLFFWGVVFNVGWGSSLLILRITFFNSYCLAVLGGSCWLNPDGSILLEEKFDFRSCDRSSSGSCLQAYQNSKRLEPRAVPCRSAAARSPSWLVDWSVSSDDSGFFGSDLEPGKSLSIEDFHTLKSFWRDLELEAHQGLKNLPGGWRTTVQLVVLEICIIIPYGLDSKRLVVGVDLPFKTSDWSWMRHCNSAPSLRFANRLRKLGIKPMQENFLTFIEVI